MTAGQSEDSRKSRFSPRRPSPSSGKGRSSARDLRWPWADGEPDSGVIGLRCRFHGDRLQGSRSLVGGSCQDTGHPEGLLPSPVQVGECPSESHERGEHGQACDPAPIPAGLAGRQEIARSAEQFPGRVGLGMRPHGARAARAKPSAALPSSVLPVAS